MKKEQKLEQQQNSDSTADNSQVAQNLMLSDAGAELLNPRFEVIAEASKRTKNLYYESKQN